MASDKKSAAGRRLEFPFAVPLTREEAIRIPARNLAYIGDSIFELHTRIRHLFQHGSPVKDLHGSVVSIVRAQNQARVFDQILPRVSDQERDWLKSWRNAKLPKRPLSVPNATYARSTAFEAWVGFLALTGQQDRVMELVNLAHQKEEPSDETPETASEE